MMIRSVLLASLAAVVVLSSTPGVLAQTMLQVSPNPANTANQSLTQEDISLRGHLSSIPKGTMMMIKLDHPVNTASNKVGDPISAIIEADVYLDNQIAIPAGSRIDGAVTSVIPASRMGKSGSLELQFYTIRTTFGSTVPIRAHIVTDDSTGVIRGDSPQAQVLKGVGTAAGGTAVGTLMGTAAGSLLGSAGSGAVFGLAAGSLVGIGYAMTREGKHVSLPSGARMSIILDQPIAIN